MASAAFTGLLYSFATVVEVVNAVTVEGLDVESIAAMSFSAVFGLHVRLPVERLAFRFTTLDEAMSSKRPSLPSFW